MSSFEQRLYKQRMEEFPPEIQRLSVHNPAISRIAKEYAIGRICFLDEALAQMVIALAQNWNELTKQQFELFMAGGVPMMVPKQTEAP